MGIRMDESNATAYFGVAYVCSIQGDLADAITFYRTALKYEKKYPPIYANLAKALLVQSHNKSLEAPKLLDEAIRLDPKSADAYYTYACYYAGKADWEKARANINKAAAFGPKSLLHSSLN